MKNGYGLIVCTSIGGGNSTAVKYLKEKRADGCIIFAQKVTDEMITSVSSKNYPLVLLDRNLNNDSTVKIEVNNRNGGFTATEYLIKHGHRKIAHISGPPESYNSQMRIEGYKDALETYQIDYLSKWNIVGDFTKKGGELATTMLLAQEEKPTASFMETTKWR